MRNRKLSALLALFFATLAILFTADAANAESSVGGSSGSATAAASGTVSSGLIQLGPNIAGDVTALTVIIAGTTTAQTEVLGIYSVAAGLPTTRLSSCSASVAGTTGNKFISCVPTPTLTLVPRTLYAVAIEGNGADQYLGFNIQGVDYSFSTGPTYGSQTGLPATLSGVAITGSTVSPGMLISYTSTQNNAVTVSNFPTPQATVAVNNFPATQAVSGTVGVNNFPTPVSTVAVSNLPATQAVSGTVEVNNFPATQAVSGTVGVNNFPASFNVGNWPTLQHVSVDNARILVGLDTAYANAVAVNNFPVTQAVSGTVGVNNFPTPQATVAVNNFPTPVSTVAVNNFPTPVSTVAVNNFPTSQPVTVATPLAVTVPTPVPVTGITGGGSSGSGNGDAATLPSPAAYNPGDTGNWNDVGPWWAAVIFALVLTPFAWLTLTGGLRRIFRSHA